MATDGLGLADTGREERVAAGMTSAASHTRGESAAAIDRCGVCGLVIPSRTAALAPRYCPRCLALRRALVPLRPLETGAPIGAYAPMRLELRLLPTPETPGIARRRLVEAYAAQLDRNELQDAKLLTSELVTNAFLHGRGPIEVTVLLDENRLTVDVTDEGDGFEAAGRGYEPLGVGGLGLKIVDAVASRWGVHEGSSHVWFELECGRRLGAAQTPNP